MPTNARAALFQPFDSLKGLRDLFAKQEEIIVPARILSEDDKEVLDQKIHQIEKGQIITVEYYKEDRYVQVTGLVSKINLEMYLLQIVEKKIPLRHIVDIQLEEDAIECEPDAF